VFSSAYILHNSTCICCRQKSRVQNICGRNSYFSLQNQSLLSVNFFLFVKVLLVETLKTPAIFEITTSYIYTYTHHLNDRTITMASTKWVQSISYGIRNKTSANLSWSAVITGTIRKRCSNILFPLPVWRRRPPLQCWPRRLHPLCIPLILYLHYHLLHHHHHHHSSSINACLITWLQYISTFWKHTRCWI